MTLRPIFSVSNIRVFGFLRNLMLLCVQLGIVLGLSGQSNFLNVSNQLNIVSDQTGGYLGAGMSVADFNGDGIDDLSLAHHGGQLKFYLGDGVGFSAYLLNLSDYPYEAKSIIWVDIDNDGDQDLFITYRLEPNRMYLNQGDLFMEDVSNSCGILMADRRSYGASFGDYDN
ncbi:MAG: VCBS repeat-containing protein, partial [Crocinitomicaceae bacterium]|nr:VCBS repeat-containing protein [Crocinitomicaceae bacterium]